MGNQSVARLIEGRRPSHQAAGNAPSPPIPNPRAADSADAPATGGSRHTESIESNKTSDDPAVMHQGAGGQIQRTPDEFVKSWKGWTNKDWPEVMAAAKLARAEGRPWSFVEAQINKELEKRLGREELAEVRYYLEGGFFQQAFEAPPSLAPLTQGKGQAQGRGGALTPVGGSAASARPDRPRNKMAGAKLAEPTALPPKRTAPASRPPSGLPEEVGTAVQNQVAQLPPSPEAELAAAAGALANAQTTGTEAETKLSPLLKDQENLPLATIAENTLRDIGVTEPPPRLSWAQWAQAQVGSAVGAVKSFAGGLTKKDSAQLGATGASVANSATGAGANIAIAAGDASSAAVGIASVTPIINFILSPILILFQLGELRKNCNEYSKLRQRFNDAIREAEGGDYDPLIVREVARQLEEKYGQAVEGVASLAASMVTLSVGAVVAVVGGASLVTLLASNPVGWGIAAALLGGAMLVSGYLAVKKLGKLILGETVLYGVERLVDEMAKTIYSDFINKLPVGIEAVQRLELSNSIAAEPDAEGMQSFENPLPGLQDPKKKRTPLPAIGTPGFKENKKDAAIRMIKEKLMARIG